MKPADVIIDNQTAPTHALENSLLLIKLVRHKISVKFYFTIYTVLYELYLTSEFIKRHTDYESPDSVLGKSSFFGLFFFFVKMFWMLWILVITFLQMSHCDDRLKMLKTRHIFASYFDPSHVFLFFYFIKGVLLDDESPFNVKEVTGLLQ